MSTTNDSGPPITPALFYRDAPAAIAWLEKAFGFRSRLVVPGESGRIDHAEMSLGGGAIMLATAKPDRGWLSPKDLPALHQIVCVFIPDVDAHCERARAAGAEIVEEPHDTSYGSLGYAALDLEGHRWDFGTYRPGGFWTDDPA